MDMTIPGGGDYFRYEITIMFYNSRYWLIRGEEHLPNMLQNNGPYPKPVGCVIVKSHQTASSTLLKGKSLSDMWMINPLIVERLRNEEMLVEITIDD
ncbi:MAG: hypothetical protein AAGC57_02370 [Pseudomonadota bacterium]